MKQITLEYEDKIYTLEFTRDSVKDVERMGFNCADIGKAPATQIQRLVRGAFMSQHSNMKGQKIDEIFDAFGENKGKLVEKLLEIYVDTVHSLTNGEEGDEGKNVKWEANW